MASIGSRGPADPHRRAPFGGCARARSRSPAALPPCPVQPGLLGLGSVPRACPSSSPTSRCSPSRSPAPSRRAETASSLYAAGKADLDRRRRLPRARPRRDALRPGGDRRLPIRLEPRQRGEVCGVRRARPGGAAARAAGVGPQCDLSSRVAVWSAAATGWGLLQFLGVVDEFEGRRPGQRETSFLGVHDFAALSAAALALALVATAFGLRGRGERQLAWSAGVGGTLGVVLSGALASVGAVLLGAAIVGVAAWHRGALTLRRALVLDRDRRRRRRGLARDP